MSISDSEGAQTVDRAVAILRHLASCGGEGSRLVDVQKMTALSKPTVHRILTSLARHGLVEQDAETRRYRLGMETAVLGWSAARGPYDLREICHADMAALAQETGDTVFLSVRSGHDLVCIERTMGPYPIKAFTVDVGTRRPLGVGAGGIMMIALLEEQEIDSVFDAIRAPLANYPNAPEQMVRDAVVNARRDGYALSDGLVLKEVRGLAVPLCDTRGHAVATLSIGAIRDRISAQRIPELVAALEHRRKKIERKLRPGSV